MHSRQFDFAQFLALLPRHPFNACVRRHKGKRWTRGFSCRDQFLCSIFAPLIYRENLRDIESCWLASGPEACRVTRGFAEVLC
ncbi:MAG: DUF4372 domain-containing protein [Planctomycetaceae bacterium]